MLIGTYLDLFTGEFGSACFNDCGEIIPYFKEKGKYVVLLTADPEVPYFINAVVEDADHDLEDDAYVVLNFRGEELL